MIQCSTLLCFFLTTLEFSFILQQPSSAPSGSPFLSGKPSSAPSDSPSLSGKVSLANQSFCSCDVMHSLIRFSSLFLLSFCITKTDEHRNNRPIQPLLHTSTTHQLSTPPRPPNLRPLLSLSRNRRRARCTCRCPTFAKLSHHLV